MKSFLFASILVFFLTGFSTEATAQWRRHKQKEKKEQKNESAFIEDIEVSPSKSGGTVNVNPVTAKENRFVAIKGSQVSGEPHIQAFQFKYGQILNRDVESITNAPLFHFIDVWWATPYRYGGNSRQGIDCSAFSSVLFSSVYGVQLARTARDQYNNSEKIGMDEVQEGDLLFFNTRGGVSHVGISLGGRYFVHASTSNGVMISSLDEDYYNRRLVGAGRMPAGQIAQKSISR